MATNRLEISGAIDVTQFWPSGESDADTTKILLRVTPGSIRVTLAGKNSAQPTSAFDGAVIVGGRKKDGDREVKPVIKNGLITVRLQRVDAPELHYQPDARGSEGKLKGTGLIKKYRQRQAETATARFRRFLQASGGSSVPCTFVSELNPSEGPGAAIDKYGRFVGDIVLADRTNLNLWLLAQGLATVALYDSMLPHEIDESISAWRSGRKLAAGIARLYQARFNRFDQSIVYRPPPAATADEKSSRFIHPKFYRRQTTWWAFSQAGLFAGDFREWLDSKTEECWYLPEFRQKGRKATRYRLYEREFDGDGVGWEPEEFIFKEASSTLKREAAAQQFVAVTDW
jgi:endonuclease YncB( thermonuclease family)